MEENKPATSVLPDLGKRSRVEDEDKKDTRRGRFSTSESTDVKDQEGMVISIKREEDEMSTEYNSKATVTTMESSSTTIAEMKDVKPLHTQFKDDLNIDSDTSTIEDQDQQDIVRFQSMEHFDPIDDKDRTSFPWLHFDPIDDKDRTSFPWFPQSEDSTDGNDMDTETNAEPHTKNQGEDDMDTNPDAEPLAKKQAEDLEFEFATWEAFESNLEKRLLYPSDRISLSNEILSWCSRFCCLFPKDYEFHKEDMIQLWMAQEAFQNPLSGEVKEDTVGMYFEALEQERIFRQSGLDRSTGLIRYKLNRSFVDVLQKLCPDEYFTMWNANSCISETTLYSSFQESNTDPSTLKDLYQAKRLCTLFILHEFGSHISQVPRELFLELPLLRVLDFSHTSITMLPNSIGNLKELRYLNLSGTRITTLPNSLCSLYQMQTLKLRGCLMFDGPPKGITKLTNLQHFDLDLACLLISMPPGFGNLTKLQSLQAFVVGKEKGYHITELKHMVNLSGTLRILRLDNVSSPEEAKEAALDEKKFIHKLELNWSELQDGFEILENLQPHRELRELLIVKYGGAKFPSWIGDPLFSELVTVTLHDCGNCEFLPTLGKLPFLNDLYLSEMHDVVALDNNIYLSEMHDVIALDHSWFGLLPDIRNNNIYLSEMPIAFPKLKTLTLNGMPKLVGWTRMVEGDFPNLQKLSISECPNLFALNELSLLKSLLQLEISLCPAFKCFPNSGLPASLQTLAIIECPDLTKWLHKDGQDSLKHGPIRNVWIDYQQIFPVQPSPTMSLPVMPTSNVDKNKGTIDGSSTSTLDVENKDEGNKSELEQILLGARRRWLQPSEICEILWNHEKFQFCQEPLDKPPSGTLLLFHTEEMKQFCQEPLDKPPSGTLLLFDTEEMKQLAEQERDGNNWRNKKGMKQLAEQLSDEKTVAEAMKHLIRDAHNWRKKKDGKTVAEAMKHLKRDGHNWRKEKDGKTIAEAGRKLKVAGANVIQAYYARDEDNENFQRRVYWLLDDHYKSIVLVHYLEVHDQPT